MGRQQGLLVDIQALFRKDRFPIGKIGNERGNTHAQKKKGGIKPMVRVSSMTCMQTKSSLLSPKQALDAAPQ